MEKSTERELWVVYNRGRSATWFSSEKALSAKQKAETFIKSETGLDGKIFAGAKTAEQALAAYNSLKEK